MWQMVDIQVNDSVSGLFGFLKGYPTRAYRKGVHTLISYWLPLDYSLSNFSYQGIMVNVRDEDYGKRYNSTGWLLARDLTIAHAPANLLTFLKDLEIDILNTNRQANPLPIKGQILQWLSYGFHSINDVERFGKLFYQAGYDPEDIIAIYSNIGQNNKEYHRRLLNTIKGVCIR